MKLTRARQGISKKHSVCSDSTLADSARILDTGIRFMAPSKCPYRLELCVCERALLLDCKPSSSMPNFDIVFNPESAGLCICSHMLSYVMPKTILKFKVLSD